MNVNIIIILSKCTVGIAGSSFIYLKFEFQTDISDWIIVEDAWIYVDSFDDEKSNCVSVNCWL